MFASEFGIRPWEWDRLTWPEADALMGCADQMFAEAKKAGAS